MVNKEIIKKLNELPPSILVQVEDFINDLFSKYNSKEVRQEDKTNDKPLSQYKAIGMWKDREDMEDSYQWKRNIRKEQWRN